MKLLKEWEMKENYRKGPHILWAGKSCFTQMQLCTADVMPEAMEHHGSGAHIGGVIGAWPKSQDWRGKCRGSRKNERITARKDERHVALREIGNPVPPDLCWEEGLGWFQSHPQGGSQA